MQNKGEDTFCFLQNYNSLFDALLDLGITKSRIKKSLIPKKFLNKVIRIRDSLHISINLRNHLRINPNFFLLEERNELEKIKIVYENEEFIALNKPALTHSHPLSYDDSNNCLSYLRSIGKTSSLEVNTSDYDRGLLHRLDYETSGLLLAIKNDRRNNESLRRENLQKIFKERLHLKRYLAIVWGNFNDNGIEEHFLKPIGHKNKKMKIIDGEENQGQRAIAKFQRLAFNEKDNCSLVQIDLITGCRHQIRIQLSHLGHFILGDPLYSKKNQERTYKRMYLHAYHYIWRDGLNEKQDFTSCPLSFREFFNLDILMQK